MVPNQHLKKFWFLLIYSENLYRSPTIDWGIKSTRLRWAGHVARMEEGMSAFKILTGNPAEKRSLRKPRRR